MTKQVLIKLESAFLRDIDRVVKEKHYQSRTEFIREVLREKVDEDRIKTAMAAIEKFRGSSKRKITNAEYERIRNEAFFKLG